jgi:hypothetical protein
VGFKNISLEDAETPEAKLFLQYILRYYNSTKISTQMHLIHGSGPVWYTDVIPPKTLYFNFQESHIIGSTMFISSMMDAAFDLPDEHQDIPMSMSTPPQNKSLDKSPTSKTIRLTDHIIRKLKSQLNLLATAFSTMNDALNFSIHDVHYNLI